MPSRLGGQLFTIGYEQAAFATVLAALQAAGVKHLVDVRDLPLSRRAGFSKTALSAGLREAGIAYTHLRPLGTPPAGREANRRRRWPAFWHIVETSLNTPEARHALHEATTIAQAGNTCLLCYEADPHTCHRLRVAQLMCDAHPFTLTHLQAAI